MRDCPSIFILLFVCMTSGCASDALTGPDVAGMSDVSDRLLYKRVVLEFVEQYASRSEINCVADTPETREIFRDWKGVPLQFGMAGIKMMDGGLRDERTRQGAVAFTFSLTVSDQDKEVIWVHWYRSPIGSMGFQYTLFKRNKRWVIGDHWTEIVS